MSTTKAQQRLIDLTAQQAIRKEEGVRLYRARPEQLPFHLSDASERLVFGGVRSGKTVAAVAEVASAATGIPLKGPDGELLPFKYPTDRPLLIWVIGYDEKHIARLYKKFFKKDLFRVIRDLKTNELRAYRPWDPEDRARKKETKPSPPMIPERMIAHKVFKSRGAEVFLVIALTNGTEIHAYSSKAEPGKGEAVDVILIDENIACASHIEEWQSRLSDVKGKLIWSAWAYQQNDALILMKDRADKQADLPNPDVFALRLTFSDNPYIDEDEKRKRKEGWRAAGIGVLLSRDEGVFRSDLVKVFPEFDVATHGIPRADGPDALEKALAANNYQVPETWTHYVALDPGTTHPALVFWAVPPPSVGDFIVVYDEICMEQCDADDMAQEMAKRYPNRVYQTFIMDWHMGRQKPASFGKTVRQQCAEAFQRHGLKSRTTGSSFIFGSDDIAARNMIVRQWLRRRADGTTRLRFLTCNLPTMIDQFRRYLKKITRDDVQEDVVKRANDTMDCNGYLGMYLAPLIDAGLGYVQPVENSQHPVRKIVDSIRALKRRREMDSETIFVGAGAAPEYAMF